MNLKLKFWNDERLSFKLFYQVFYVFTIAIYENI